MYVALASEAWHARFWETNTDLKPLLLLFGEHAFFHHPRLDRDAGKAVEAQPDVAIKFTACLP